MNILIPYRTYGNISDHKAGMVNGGTERVIDLIRENYENVHVLNFTDSDVEARRVTEMVALRAAEIKADLIISNYYSTTLTVTLQKRLPNTPILCLIHVLADSLPAEGFLKKAKTFLENGGSVGMVSRYQHNNWNSFAKRRGYPELEVAGYVKPVPSTYHGPIVKKADRTYVDAITVGRGDRYKDPFCIHRRIQKLIKSNNDGDGITAAVYTNTTNLDPEYHKENDFSALSDRCKVYYNEAHDSIMEKIGQSKVYVATGWGQMETYGIAVLEAYERGVPALLISTKDEGAERITDDPRYYRIVKKSDPNEVFLKAYRELISLDDCELQELADLTRQQNSIGVWKNMMDNLIQKTLSNHANKLSTTATLE